MTSAKDQLRRRLLAARHAVDPAVHRAEAAALARHVGAFATIATVCAYAPVGGEPGSPQMLDALAAAGVRVLLPVTPSTAEPLWWGEYRPGRLVRAARFGLLEPAGTPLPPSTLAEAAVVLVPALAVDRHGARLGRGAGCYDRSLPLRDPAARLVAVVRDEELLDELPAEPHDVPMTDALTPRGGLVRLG